MTNTLSTHQPEPPARPASAGGRSTISCIICQALYTPSPTHAYLLQAPSIAFESAFMSMCHFCFRCRRPSCPSCWDDVHAVCGMCTLEANLPFRSSAAPLSGTLFAPARQSQSKRIHVEPERFVCIRPGRFQNAALPIAPLDTATTLPVRALVPNRSNRLPSEKSHIAKPAPVPPPTIVHLYPFSPAYPDIDEIATRPETRPSRFSKIMNGITTLLLLVLISILILIITAEFSSQANTLIATLLHINIRVEIAYLLQLLGSLHL